MKRLFIHHPLFRILYPAFYGCLVYVLVLLIFGTTQQLTEHFFSAEVLLCVGLAYLLSESLRLTVLLLDRWYPLTRNLHLRMMLQFGVGILCSLIVISAGVSAYFTYVVGYTVFNQELLILNSVFLVSSLLYNVVYYGIQLLNRYNQARLQQLEVLRQKTARQLAGLRQQVNPELLYSALENLLSLIPENPAAAETYLDHLAALYRYSLETQHLDLVPVQSEVGALQHFMHVRTQTISNCFTFHLENRMPDFQDSQLIPGTLLQLTGRILDTSIINPLQPFSLDCQASPSEITLRFAPNNKLQQPQPLPDLVAELNQDYSYFSPEPVQLVRKFGRFEVRIPVVQLQPEPAL